MEMVNSKKLLQVISFKDGLTGFQPKDARGVDRTAGQVTIHDHSSGSEASSNESEEEEERRQPRQVKKRMEIARERPKKAVAEKPSQRARVAEPAAAAAVKPARFDATRARPKSTAPGAYKAREAAKAQNQKEEESVIKPVVEESKKVEVEYKKIENGRRGSISSVSSASSGASSSPTSSRDYSDSENEDKAGQKKKDEKASEADRSVNVAVVKKEEQEIVTKEVAMNEQDVSEGDKYDVPKGGRTDDGEEKDEWTAKGPLAPVITAVEPGIEDEEKEASESRTPTVGEEEKTEEFSTEVTVIAPVEEEKEQDDTVQKEEKEAVPPLILPVEEDKETMESPTSQEPEVEGYISQETDTVEGSQELKAEDEPDIADRTAPAPVVTSVTATTTEVKETVKDTKASPPRRGSGALSSSSSSSISSSSSSGSAAISDGGPNLQNDPTAVADGDKQETAGNPRIVRGDNIEERIVDDNEERDLPPESATVVVSSVQAQTEEKGSKKEAVADKKADSSSFDSSSDSDSDSGEASDSDSENNKVNSAPTSVNKDALIETKADVHNSDHGRRNSEGRYVSDSDPEATHGGNDPDNVANGTEGTTKTAKPPAAPQPKPHDGSVLPLLDMKLVTLELKGIMLNKTQVYETSQFLEKKDRIGQLNLVNCGLDDDDVQKLMEGLKVSSSTPVLLNLNLNPLTSGCVPHILDILRAKPSIEAILLEGTRLGDEGIEKLINGILSLHEEKKAKQEEEEEEERNVKEIRELDLSDCKMGDDGALAVARLIRSDMDIDTLWLSSNPAISVEGWRTIGNALSHNNYLETLTLDHNFIGDEGVETIAHGLHNNRSLTAIDMNHVGITDRGGKCLMDLLKRNTVLLEITLVGNKIPAHQLEEIKKYMSLNRTMGGSN